MCRINRRQGFLEVLAEILKYLRRIDKKVGTLMSATQDKLNEIATKLDGVSTDLATTGAGLRADIDDLKRQVAEGQNVDFTAVDAKVDAIAEASRVLSALNDETVQEPAPEPTPDQPQP